MCTFTGFMNFPPPISAVMYNKVNDLLFSSYTTVANQSTLNAAKDSCEKLLAKGHALNSDDQSMDWTVWWCLVKKGA